MPRTCTICRHKARDDIERGLIAHTPFRQLAATYAVSKSALVRHSDDHLPESLAKAAEAQEAARGDDLLGQITGLLGRAEEILNSTTRAPAGKGALAEPEEWAPDYRVALMAIRESRGCIELLAKLKGQLDAGTTINVVMMPEWQVVQAAILAALSPYSEARMAVAGALSKIQSHHAPGHA